MVNYTDGQRGSVLKQWYVPDVSIYENELNVHVLYLKIYKKNYNLQ